MIIYYQFTIVKQEPKRVIVCNRGYLVSRYFFKIIDMILVLVLFAVSIILSFSFAGQKMTNQTWTNVDL